MDRSPFDRLHAELRTKIYDYALTFDRDVRRCLSRSRSNVEPRIVLMELP